MDGSIAFCVDLCKIWYLPNEKKKNQFICCSDFIIFSQVNLSKWLREQTAKSAQKRQNQRGT